MHRRRELMMQKRRVLPPGYEQFEYIEGSGSQFLETDIYPQDNDAVEIVFSSNVQGDNFRPFGSYLPGVAVDGYRGIRIITNDFNHYGYAVIGNGTVQSLSCSHSGLWVLDGTEIVSNLPIKSQTIKTITIFKARYTNGGALYGNGLMKLYRFKYIRNGTVIADFYPCEEKSTGRIGVYDLANNAFVGNSGTGEFSVPQ